MLFLVPFPILIRTKVCVSHKNLKLPNPHSTVEKGNCVKQFLCRNFKLVDETLNFLDLLSHYFMVEL